MIELTLQEIANAISAKLIDSRAAETLVTGSVETDSRLVAAGSLFVAKPGEFTDGHLFVGAARDAGAVGADDGGGDGGGSE